MSAATLRFGLSLLLLAPLGHAAPTGFEPLGPTARGRILTQLEAEALRFASGSDGAFVATSPAHRIRATLDGGGVALTPRTDAAWQVSQRLLAWGRDDQLAVLMPTRPVVTSEDDEDDRVEYRHEGLTEWYVNRREGLEQGFTIPRRPHGEEGELVVEMGLAGDLTPELSGDRLTFRDDDGRAVLRYAGLLTWDATGRELPSVMELRDTGSDARIRLSVDDADAVYPVTIDPTWTEVTKLIAGDPMASAFFGDAVAASGDTVVCGAPGADGTGATHVFERNEGGPDAWGQVAKLTASDAAAADLFGISVSVSGDTVVCGAQFDDDDGDRSGSAYVFQRDHGGAGAWGQVAKLTAGDAAAGDQFGRRVSVSGDLVVCGAHRNGDAGARSGSAYVFGRDHGGADAWGQVAKLTADDAAAGDQFGYSVAVSDDIVVCGANNDDGVTGAAYVFGRDVGGADAWGQVAKLTASDGMPNEEFGFSVAASGDTVVCGAASPINGSVGAAYVYERDEGGADAWGEVAKLVASDGEAADIFGVSVAVSGDWVACGAHEEDEGADAAGAVYVFGRDEGGTGAWGQLDKLLASDPGDSDRFGASVGLSGLTLVVGSSGNDDDGDDSGSAYVFAGPTPPSPIPTLPEWGLILLAASVATVGAAVLRRAG